MANSPEDIRAAQALRFLVFNVEMNEGLQSSFATSLDADRFDSVCDHLLVEHVLTGQIVGTYRLQTGTRAMVNLGYYSATEFDLTAFDAVRAETVELGRACVHSAHRHLAVLGLLWKGIVQYAHNREARYLIGCSSLPTEDEKTGATVYRQLLKRHAAPVNFTTSPLEHCACRLDEELPEPVKAPKLLSAYLSLGAVICAAPAVDREFHTIDFLTLLDLQSLPPTVATKLLS